MYIHASIYVKVNIIIANSNLKLELIVKFWLTVMQLKVHLIQIWVNLLYTTKLVILFMLKISKSILLINLSGIIETKSAHIGYI